ncbi:MAG TPA: TRAFs-binding domain-containing protein [Pyrinomonadaceae bacterium]
MKYKPQPLDTSDVALPEGVLDLGEHLARNTHENWARQRISDGWRYGPERSDARKEHPCLVPYEELPESEKQYDRKTATEALKAIIKLGYRLENPATEAESEAQPDADGAAPGQVPQNLDEFDLTGLFTVWQARNREQWAGNQEIYVRLGDRILKSGEPLLAHDVLTEGLKFWPASVRLRQLQALALARSGASKRASRILTCLYEEGNTDEETLGLLARTHKDLWAQSADPEEKAHQLRLAYKFYAKAYRLSRGYWTGINAATTALLSGQNDRAALLARKVRSACLRDLKATKEKGGDTYWALATLGEAALILNEWREAEEWYAQAAEAGRGRFGELNSTRRNARLIVGALGGDRARIDQYFRIPGVVVFAGHMIDRPERETPRFPPRLEDAVREAIREKLKKLNAGLGYSSAACGSDIIFLETMLELGGETHVILPYNQQQFAHDSVEIAVGGRWRERFEQMLQSAAEVLFASEQRMEGGVPFEYANLLIHGMASIRAGQIETGMTPLAVWDGKRGDGAGGTASIVEHWRAVGEEVEVIDLAEILGRECPEVGEAGKRQLKSAPSHTVEEKSEFPTEMIAILFADAVNFSKLTEDELPRFVRHFLGTVGDLSSNYEHRPVMKNTWGDGLYFVFKGVADAGRFALELCRRLGATDWVAKGLPKDLSLRIALHAGPVYFCTDPVTGRPNYMGTHVSRAARIEPITPPGQVYASQAFAALASAQHVREFTCEYVGQTPLAKGYGTFPTYHVRPRESRQIA